MAIFTAIASTISLISSWTITIGSLGTFAIGNFLLRTAVSLGVSALAKAFAGKDQGQNPFSIQGNVRTGGIVPRSFPMGPALTAGSLVWQTEWGNLGGTPNAYYTQVIALSDLPVAGLKRWFINNQAVTLAEEESEFGFAAVEYIENGSEYAWVKFYDGTQTIADPFLVNKVSESAPREYSPDRIGYGVAYAIVTFRINDDMFTGFPTSKFVLDGVKLYDISRDDTAGGVGAQRWGDPSTWGGDGDALPAVQAYNLARGIYYRRDTVGGSATESATVALEAGLVSLTLRIVGGGGGGGGVTSANGAATTVTLKDGETVVQTWTAAGGAAGAMSNYANETTVKGGKTPLSPRGDGGLGIVHVFEGGGEGAGLLQQGYLGGSAGEYVEVIGYDISGLAAPVLEIAIGAGGVALGGVTDGRNGYVDYVSGLAAAAIKPEWFYGLQGVTAARLPAAHWVAQVEKCRVEIEGEGGVFEPMYRCAGEVTVNSEIGSAFEAILTACAGRMSEVGGVFKIYVGAPDAPIASITDEDILSTSPQSFTPFLGLSETVNGVVASYPSPDNGYAMTASAPLYNPAFEAEDGKRRLMTTVQLSFVPFPMQAQRLLKGELEAARRARRHTFTLPARCRKVEPGDTVEFSSVRNGYSGKWFRVDGTIDLPNCDLIVDLTEVDPTDHGSFNPATDYTPVTPSDVIPVRPPAQAVVGFNPVARDVRDGAGTPRRPAILMQWDTTIEGVEGLKFEVRIAGQTDPIATAQTGAFERGEYLVEAGLVGAQAYEVKAKYIPTTKRRVAWTAWQPVATNDTRLTPADIGPGSIEWSALAQEVTDEIGSSAAFAATAEAAADAAEIAKLAAEAARGDAEDARDGAYTSQTLAASAANGAVAAVAATYPAQPSLPAEVWTLSLGQTSGAFPRAAVDPARLITGDPDFGACFESTTANETFGHARAWSFDRSRAYLVKVRAKVINDGSTGGCRVIVGYSTHSNGGLTGHDVNQQVTLVDPLAVSAGVAEFTVLVKPDTLTDLGTFTGYSHTLNHDADSDLADLIAFHFRINGGSITNGVARVGLFEVKDVTDVLAANISAKASFDAEQAALSYRDESGTYAGAASSAKVAAETARDNAAGSATAAASSASSAASSQTAAGSSATAANSAKVAAETARDNAAGSASAAASSASAASASQTAAGSSASAANTSKLAADTAKAAAQTAETNAVAAKNSAETAAAGAEFARDVAARVMGGGECSNPIFVEGLAPFTTSAGTGSSIARVATGGKYGACVEYSTGSTLTADAPQIIYNATDGGGLIASDVEAVEIDFEVEMIAGSWGSACISVQWQGGSGGNLRNVYTFLSDAITSRNGKVQRVKALIERPADYVAGSIDHLKVILFGNRNGVGYTASDYSARIHRFDFQIMSQSASALISQRAVADLQGKAEAALVFRAKAGTSDGSVVVAAWDDPAGTSGSKIKLTGDEIEFDGMSVFNDALQSSNFATGSTGWRIRKGGAAEFNKLIDRSAMVDGAVSNGGVLVGYTTPGERDDSQGTGSLSLGAWSLGEFWNVSGRITYRARGYTYTTTENPKEGTLYWKATEATIPLLQMRTHDGVSWSSWSTFKTFAAATTDVWVTDDFIVSMQGVYGNVQLRFLITINGAQSIQVAGPSANVRQTNVSDVVTVGRSLVR